MQGFQEIKDAAARAWQEQGGFDPSIGGGMKRVREDEDDEEYDDKGEGTRSKYKCGLCGQVTSLIPLLALEHSVLPGRHVLSHRVLVLHLP